LLALAQKLLAPLLQQPPQYNTATKQANRIETHQIWCLPVSGEQMAFPFVRQIFAIRRIVEPTDRTQKMSDEIAYGITSVPHVDGATQNASAVLGNFRTHWSIESKSHARRDKSYREDTCQVRNHNAARVLTAFRQMAIFLCEMNVHCIRIKKDKRCLPELFRYCSFNDGPSLVLAWFKRRRAFRS
jgi:predicted transposase YbfD/YdcC